MTDIEVPVGSLELAAQLEREGHLTPTGLHLTDPDMPQATWEALGWMLGRMHTSCVWWIGDWVLFGEKVYGEEASQDTELKATGLASETIRQYAWLCDRIPAKRRRLSLPMSVHRAVATLEPREQEKWLKKAEKGDWSARQLRAAMDEANAVTSGDGAVTDGNAAPAVNRELAVEVGFAILRDAVPNTDGMTYLVPNEDISRLRAALGGE